MLRSNKVKVEDKWWPSTSRFTTTVTTPVWFGCHLLGNQFRIAVDLRSAKPLRRAPGAAAVESYLGGSSVSRFRTLQVSNTALHVVGLPRPTVVQYSIVPVVGPDRDHLQPSLPDASAQTPPMTVSGQASAHVSAYFNRGIVSAQWVSRMLDAIGRNAKLSDLIAQTNNSLRNALSGLLRSQLLQLIYELNDPELIPALVALGQKCHLILANGPFKPPDNDENIKVRAQLRGKIDLHDRKVGKGHFANNPQSWHGPVDNAIRRRRQEVRKCASRQRQGRRHTPGRDAAQRQDRERQGRLRRQRDRTLS
jgi:hypothetical protein